MNDPWGAERELEPDHTTAGVPHHVRPFDAEMFQERKGVLGLLLDAERTRERRAADESPAVVTDEMMPLSEGRLSRQRGERVSDVTSVDQKHRLSLAAGLVLQPVVLVRHYSRTAEAILTTLGGRTTRPGPLSRHEEDRAVATLPRNPQLTIVGLHSRELSMH